MGYFPNWLTSLRFFGLLAAVAALGACGGQNCDRPETYQSSRMAAPITVPEGLSTPAGHAIQRVPDVASTAPVLGGCLDRPPRFLAVEGSSGQPTPAAPAAPSGPFSVGPAAATADQQIEDMVESWARAWGRADADGVVGYYAAGFEPGDSSDPADWLQARRDAVAGSAAEQVLIETLEITDLKERSATVRFIQHFVTDGQSSALVKELGVEVDGDRWRIVRETVIDVL